MEYTLIFPDGNRKTFDLDKNCSDEQEYFNLVKRKTLENSDEALIYIKKVDDKTFSVNHTDLLIKIERLTELQDYDMEYGKSVLDKIRDPNVSAKEKLAALKKNFSSESGFFYNVRTHALSLSDRRKLNDVEKELDSHIDDQGRYAVHIGMTGPSFHRSDSINLGEGSAYNINRNTIRIGNYAKSAKGAISLGAFNNAKGQNSVVISGVPLLGTKDNSFYVGSVDSIKGSDVVTNVTKYPTDEYRSLAYNINTGEIVYME